MAEYTSDMTDLLDDEREDRVVSEDGVIIERHGEDTTVYLDGKDDEPESTNFDENLAIAMSKTDRARIADELIAAVEADEESRATWKRRLDQGLELLGLEDIPDSGEDAQGSTVTHPLIAEAIVQFQSRTLPEVVPSDGPVKTTVIGESTEETDAQADRVAEYLNWRLMVDDAEWFDDTDQMLFYLPFGGSAFRKAFTDPVSGKAMSRYVKAEDFIVPYKAKSLADAQRYAHRFDMHYNDIQRAIAVGTYADTSPDEHAQPEENSSIEDIADKREASVAENDSTHRIYEVHCYRDIESDSYRQDYQIPYIITVDATDGDVLSIRRNWDEDDELHRKVVWFSHYKFMPGLGFYGFGFLHLIGGLAKSATGTVRALLDAATAANFQGGYKSKEARNAKGDTTLEWGKYKDIDLTAEELGRAFYTPPFKEPSMALFNLLGALTEAGQRFASTTETMVGEANNNAPVGTTVALIEQGQKVFSAVHRRIHRAAGCEYRLFAQLDADNLGDDPYPYQVAGAPKEIRRADFDDRIDIIPVSDPNIVSSTQRIALAQAVVQLVTDNPDLYGKKEKREAHERLLKALNVPDADKILPEAGASRRDPVTENQYMMVGQAVQAYPEQDHAAHIQLHEDAAAQYAEATGQQAQQFHAFMQAHIAEHHAHAYRQRLMQQTGMMLPPGLMPDDDPEELPIEQENMLARMLAMQTQPVPTPAERQQQAEQQELSAEQQRKQAETQAKIQRDNAEFQAKQQREQAAFQARMARDQQEWQARMQRENAGFQTDQQLKITDARYDEARDQAEWEAEQRREAEEFRRKQEREDAAAAAQTRRDGQQRALGNMDRALANSTDETED